MRKIIVSAAALCLFGFAMSASAERSPRAQPEEVACWDWSKYGPSFKKKPGKCVFMKNREEAGAYSVYVDSMDSWKNWGAPKTRVVGISRANGGFSTKAKVRLSKIQDRCGRRVYTKATFTFPEIGGKSSLRLYPC